MFRKVTKWTLVTLSLLLLLVNALPAIAAGFGGKPKLIIMDASPQMADQIRSTVPLSMQMVEEAIAVLSEGWLTMSDAEREAFRRIYDPGGTGDIDEQFVEKVLKNFRLIRQSFYRRIFVEFETEGNTCYGKRLYYTDFFRIHICPYYMIEINPERKARTFLHEMAHKALFVLDRTYYRPTNKKYAALTPEGSWTAQLPLVGLICRELARGDTLYHPDAYAHFALSVHGHR